MFRNEALIDTIDFVSNTVTKNDKLFHVFV